MGNSESKGDKDGQPPSSSAPSRRERARDASQSRTTQNHSSQSGKRGQSARTYTPPTATLIPQTSTAASTSVSSAAVTGSPASSQHSRKRSITTSTPKATPDDMGNSDSKPDRSPSRSAPLPLPSYERPKPSPLSKPVDVPAPLNHDGGFEDDADLSTAASQFGMQNSFSRPPRLPLPIDRDPEPASPLITPQDIHPPLEHDEAGELPARASLLSSTTLDDDEADIEQFAIEQNPLAQMVPTTFMWKGHASQVYVTGTFAKWEKKFRMSRDKSGVFTATIPLPAGTHHITFLVDGNPITSSDLPTTVDFTNALVNYIEIAPDSPVSDEKRPAEPLPIPGATAATDAAGRPLNIRTKAPETGDAPDSRQSSGPYGSQPPSTRAHPATTQPKKLKPGLPRPKYTSEIPEILMHLDLYNTPDDERYRRASKAIDNLPRPPSMPLFMSKSILNATTPHKDDASVLTMPNHTVLNHLATSSIRNNVLATSGTTRYKRKFLTTIMYKPTHDESTPSISS